MQSVSPEILSDLAKLADNAQQFSEILGVDKVFTRKSEKLNLRIAKSVLK